MTLKSLPAVLYCPPSLSHVYLAFFLASAIECFTGNSSSKYLKLSLYKINMSSTVP